MVRFELSHPMEENVQGNAKEVVPDKDIRIRLV
jgi:hypothetical protein